MDNNMVAIWLVGILLSVIGACVMLGINLLLRALRSSSEAQQLQAHAIEGIRVTLLGVDGAGGLVARVNSLHDWRNEVQRQELERTRQENERLKTRIEESNA